MSDHNTEASPRSLATWAGVLLLVSAVAGAYGEMVVPGKLAVSGDAAATAANIQASGHLFRLGFASYLVEAICDVALTGIFYVLLRPVRRDLAFITVCFRLVSTSTFAIAAFFYFAASVVLGMKAFPPDQANALALLFMKLYGVGGGIFMVFYGVAALTLGILIHRSTYLPKPLGALLMLAGLGFVGRNFLLVLAPAYASGLLLAPKGLGMVSLGLWLLVKGVDIAKWEAISRP
ncbi:MAG TPA: DUF4386 domain-containing protein [Holophagaceae bacterium]|nr:DUF4386 domain-containing protein [Holophagaceae bacterium]